MRQYEVMLILPPDAEASVGAVVDKVGQVLGDQGTVGKVDDWGRRRLAYEIAHLNEGHYVVVEFDAQPEALSELDRTLSLSDQVVRFKVVHRAA